MTLTRLPGRATIRKVVMHKRYVFGSLAFIVVVIAGAVLGTAVGSAGGPYDDWGCPVERIATQVYTPAEGGGYATEDDALKGMVEFLAADGERTQSEYAEAIASRTGPNRYEPDTGRIYLDDRVEVQLNFEQLPDRTWTPSEVIICGPPAPADLASPYPTPISDDMGS